MGQLLNIITSSEIVELTLDTYTFPVIAYHIPSEYIESIVHNPKAMGEYVLDNFTGQNVGCAVWFSDYRNSWPGDLATENRTLQITGSLKLKYTFRSGGNWRATDTRLQFTSSGSTYDIFAARDYTGYGNFAIDPIAIICMGEGYDKVVYSNSTALEDIGGCIKYTEDPGIFAYGPMVGGCAVQPFGSGVVTSNRTFDISGTTDLSDIIRPITPGEEDPYTYGGVTEKEGGEGDFDTFSDEIPVPELPTVTVDNTGFISLYSPSIAQLKSLASYLWASTGLDLDTFKRIFTDPISTILGLTIVPVAPPTSGSNNVVLGNVDTGVSMPRISNQYVQFDCGTLNVNEFWGGYLDYSPYTSLEIYLPFIGTKPLNIDDVMGHTVHVVYNIDLLSGACCAIIESARRVLYQFIGQCSCSVPVTGRDMTNLINGILSVVGAGAGTFVATGGNPGLSGASAIGALASNVSKSKPKVEKSGSMGSMGGMLGVRSPYLIITRPRQALPAAQNRYTGYPSFITCVLSELVGYTEVYKVHLGDIPATDAEKAEIETLLMNGVIL